MATRRAVPTSSNNNDDEPPSRIISTGSDSASGLSAASAAAIIKDASSKPSDITPAVPRRVIIKLLVFTVLMVAGPISIYFLASNKLFSGQNKNIYAGALAAFMANCVLIAYVISSVQEDEGDDDGDGDKKKK